VTVYQTEYGPVEYSNYPPTARRISQTKCVYSDPPFDKRHEDIKLQPAALKAFRAAELLFGKNTIDQKRPRRLRRARAIRVSGIGWRDYDYQASLYAENSSRYAKPWVSAHVQGLAIDVDTTQPAFQNEDGVWGAPDAPIVRALLKTGWRRVRADEPWHLSWGVVA